jgi:hypothetical protein
MWLLLAHHCCLLPVKQDTLVILFRAIKESHPGQVDNELVMVEHTYRDQIAESHVRTSQLHPCVRESCRKPNPIPEFVQ